MSFCLLLLFLQIKKDDDDDVSMSCIFFSPSSAVRAPSFFRLISKKEAPLSLSLERSTRRKNRTFSGEKEQFFFSTRKRHETHTTFNSLFYSLLFEDRTTTQSIIDYMIGRVTTQCEDLSRCSSDDDHHHHRDRQRRERVRERGKEERKKKHSEATRETKGSKNS